ncbi:MAG: hypothetical protein GY749_09155 [Desulfobacteraceae bacterium]|nr:hypothetical protein [Desulfobacteraceae bacterium]
MKRVIEPILTGLENPKDLSQDDLGYVQDIGLIKTQGNIRIANDIYRQVILRELIFGTHYPRNSLVCP